MVILLEQGDPGIPKRVHDCPGTKNPQSNVLSLGLRQVVALQAWGGAVNVLPIRWSRGANWGNVHGQALDTSTSYNDVTAIGV